MATPRMIQGGGWTRIWVEHPDVGLVPIGLATGASWNEDYGVQPANVIGFIGPVDFDSQGYNLTLNMQFFVPEVRDGGPWPDGGQRSLKDFLPTRSSIQRGGGKPGEFSTMQFTNISSGQVSDVFRRVIIVSAGENVNPNSYVQGNLRLQAIERPDEDSLAV